MRETEEHRRLEASSTKGVPWKEWGPYLGERPWGLEGGTHPTMPEYRE